MLYIYILLFIFLSIYYYYLMMINHRDMSPRLISVSLQISIWNAPITMAVLYICEKGSLLFNMV